MESFLARKCPRRAGEEIARRGCFLLGDNAGCRLIFLENYRFRRWRFRESGRMLEKLSLVFNHTKIIQIMNQM